MLNALRTVVCVITVCIYCWLWLHGRQGETSSQGLRVQSAPRRQRSEYGLLATVSIVYVSLLCWFVPAFTLLPENLEV